MAGIFYFSSRPDPLNFLPSSGHAVNIDKLAHIGEYAGLVALLHRALREQGGPSALRPHLCAPALLALAYALLDEFHQELVPGRGFQLADVGYDLAGIIAALGLIWVRGRVKGEQRNRGAGGQGDRKR